MYPFQVYLKSLFYLATFSGAGYVLLKLTEPSQEKLQKIRQTGSSSDYTYEQKKKKLMLDTLKGKVNEKPVYLKSPEELKRDQ